MVQGHALLWVVLVVGGDRLAGGAGGFGGVHVLRVVGWCACLPAVAGGSHAVSAFADHGRLLRVDGPVRFRRGCYRDYADGFLCVPRSAGEHSPAGSN